MRKFHGNNNQLTSFPTQPSMVEFFGDNNPYITRDFSETQIEMITQPQSSLEAAYDQLTAIQHVVLSNIDDDYLWPQSNPPILPNDDKIQLAKFIDPEKYQYRDYLSEKYGKKDTSGFYKMKQVQYWGFHSILNDKKHKIKIIIKQVGDGNIMFWSVMPYDQKLYLKGIDED